MYRLNASGDNIRRFERNFSGVTVEHLIDVMLGAKTQDNLDFLRENYKKNKPIGHMMHDTRPVFMTFNSDGTVTVKRDEDKQRECELNATLSAMKEQITPLVEFIRIRWKGNCRPRAHGERRDAHHGALRSFHR